MSPSFRLERPEHPAVKHLILFSTPSGNEDVMDVESICQVVHFIGLMGIEPIHDQDEVRRSHIVSRPSEVLVHQ
jgi:hypothetical protein